MKHLPYENWILDEPQLTWKKSKCLKSASVYLQTLPTD